MLEVVGAGASASSKRDWHSIWNDSEEKVNMLQELDRLVGERKKANRDSQHDTEDEKKTYAAPFLLQLRMVMSRQWTSYYRDVRVSLWTLNCADDIVGPVLDGQAHAAPLLRPLQYLHLPPAGKCAFSYSRACAQL